MPWLNEPTLGFESMHHSWIGKLHFDRRYSTLCDMVHVTQSVQIGDFDDAPNCPFIVRLDAKLHMHRTCAHQKLRHWVSINLVSTYITTHIRQTFFSSWDPATGGLWGEARRIRVLSYRLLLLEHFLVRHAATSIHHRLLRVLLLVETSDRICSLLFISRIVHSRSCDGYTYWRQHLHLVDVALITQTLRVRGGDARGIRLLMVTQAGHGMVVARCHKCRLFLSPGVCDYFRVVKGSPARAEQLLLVLTLAPAFEFRYNK
jgi:hypothetical protein